MSHARNVPSADPLTSRRPPWHQASASTAHTEHMSPRRVATHLAPSGPRHESQGQAASAPEPAAGRGSVRDEGAEGGPDEGDRGVDGSSEGAGGPDEDEAREPRPSRSPSLCSAGW